MNEKTRLVTSARKTLDRLFHLLHGILLVSILPNCPRSEKMVVDFAWEVLVFGLFTFSFYRYSYEWCIIFHEFGLFLFLESSSDNLCIFLLEVYPKIHLIAANYCYKVIFGTGSIFGQQTWPLLQSKYYF